MQLTKGTSVLLKRGTRYTPSPNNPTEGSEHECIGIIAMIGKAHYNVKWENGTTNGYVEGDLRSVGPFVDIWPEI